VRLAQPVGTVQLRSALHTMLANLEAAAQPLAQVTARVFW
jgi:hypothetical protein